MRLSLVILLGLAASAGAQTPGNPRYTVAETRQGFNKLQDALDAIGDRQATILIAPGIHRDCGIQNGGRVTFRAIQPGTAVFEGVTCEDKATLVLRGQGSTVDGVVFRGLRVSDGNGAGIRIEQGDLTVTNSMFLDSQEGMLGATDRPTRITIDRSTFSGLGQCHETPSCAHSIYLENTGQISVTNSRFERGRGGHYVKLRTPSVVVSDNSFDDVGGTRTNYMIDLSDGSTGVIGGNTFVQGPNKENRSALITVAPENRKNSSAGLRIEGNVASLAPGAVGTPAFVANFSGERLALGANRLGPRIKAYEER